MYRFILLTSLALLLAAPTWAVITVGAPTASTATGTPATDWSSAFTMCALGEETGPPYANSCTSICAGTDCELVLDLGTPTQNTTYFVEGAGSIEFDAGDTLDCDMVSGTPDCEELEVTGDGDYLIMAHMRPDYLTIHGTLASPGGDARMIDALDFDTSGYRLALDRRSGSTDDGDSKFRWRCRASKTTGTSSKSGSDFASLDKQDLWTHAACVKVGAELNLYVDGAVQGSAEGSVAIGSSVDGDTAAEPFRIAENDNYDGQVDEIGISANKTWTAGQVARVRACGIAGELCTCDASSPAAYLACATDVDCGTAACSTCSSAALCSSNLCVGRGFVTGQVSCNATAP